MENIDCSTPTSAPTKCVNGCGFFGSPESANMCSKCYRNIYKKRKDADEVANAERNVKQQKIEAESIPILADKELEKAILPEKQEEKRNGENKSADSKCNKCNKKLGLTAIRCRCGLKFCAKHRYSDQHECTFDYKTHGRKALEENNPQVIGSKLQAL